MNNSTKVIDDNIEALKKYRDAWNEIPDQWENAQNALLANQILGANWENEILDGRMATLDIFKNNYIAAQQAMADAAWQSANEQIKAAQAAEAGASGTTGSAPKITTSNNSETSKTKTSGGSGSTARLDGRISKNVTLTAMYGTGTDHAKKGLNLVGEDGAETFIDNDGNASLITKPTLIPMEGGETVKNAEETEELLAPVRLIPLGIAEPLLFNPYETEMQELMENMPGFHGVEHTPISSMVQHKNFDQIPMNMIQDQSIKMSFGDINLHGVQNEDTFAKAIITKWPNKVNQALSKRMR